MIGESIQSIEWLHSTDPTDRIARNLKLAGQVGEMIYKVYQANYRHDLEDYLPDGGYYELVYEKLGSWQGCKIKWQQPSQALESNNDTYQTTLARSQSGRVLIGKNSDETTSRGVRCLSAEVFELYSHRPTIKHTASGYRRDIKTGTAEKMTEHTNQDLMRFHANNILNEMLDTIIDLEEIVTDVPRD